MDKKQEKLAQVAKIRKTSMFMLEKKDVNMPSNLNSCTN